MTRLHKHSRRTVLKTLGAGVVAGGTMTGSAAAKRGGRGPKNVVEIEAKHPDDDSDHYIFDFSKTEIESGWTTFILHNKSSSTHFGFLNRLTEDAVEALDDPEVDEDYEGDTRRERYSRAEPIPFQEAIDPYYDGDISWTEFLFGDEDDPEHDGLLEALPDWFFTDVAPVGANGLVSGGETSRTTVYLEPGVHMYVCYILNEDRKFHSTPPDYNGEVTPGMVNELTVLEEESNARPPRADLELSISSTDGIDSPGDINRPGRYTIEVTFEDQADYLNGLSHDVHLIRLEDGTTTEHVNKWMDFLDPDPEEGGYFDLGATYADRDAFVSHSGNLGPSTWIGGVQTIDTRADFVEEDTAYIDVTLKEGDYAWVSEVPNPKDAVPLDEDDNPLPPVNMLKEFTVIPPGRR